MGNPERWGGWSTDSTESFPADSERQERSENRAELPTITKREIGQELTNEVARIQKEMAIQEFIVGSGKGGPRSIHIGDSTEARERFKQMSREFQNPGTAEARMKQTKAELEDTQKLVEDLHQGKNRDGLAVFLEGHRTDEEMKIDEEIKKIENTKSDRLALLGPTPSLLKKRLDDARARKEAATLKRTQWIEHLRAGA